MPPKAKRKSQKNESKEVAPTTEMRAMLQGLGVKKVPEMEAELANNGIETRKDLADLDDGLLKELDDALKAGGITIGDRAKLKKAKIEVNEVPKKIGNGEVSVPQLVPGQAMQVATKLERVFLGIAWAGGANVDVDASCVGFSQGAVADQSQDVIFYQNLRNNTKSMVHSGDVLNSASEDQKKDLEDMERIYVWFQKLPGHIDCLVFVGSIFTSGKSFADIGNAYIRLVNADTNQELCRAPLAGSGLKGNCLVFCKLYKAPPAKGSKGPTVWQMLALGMPTTVDGMTSAPQMIPMLQKSATAYTPEPVTGGKASDGGAAAGTGKPERPPAEKTQKPRSILPCVALAVAGAAGIAAATAIYMNPELRADMMNSSIFTSCADFGAGALEFSGDALIGAGGLIGDGASAVYGWTAGVIEDAPAFEEIGDGLGSAGDFAGDGLSFGLDGAEQAGGFLGDGAQAAWGAGGDAAEWAGDAGGDAVEWAGDAGGDAVEWAGDAGGDAVGFVGDAGGDAAGWVENAAGGDMANLADGITGCCETCIASLSGIFNGGGNPIGDLVGDVIGVIQAKE